MAHETTRPSTPAALRRRWDEQRVDQVRDQLEQQAKVARGPHRVVSPWGAADDVPVDLRGLPGGKDGLAVHYVTLGSLDLSHMKGRLHVYQSELAGCTLDGAALSVGSILGRRLERCTFVAARMPKVRLAGTFVDCDFTGASLRGATLGENATFERCSFDEADLSDARLVGGRFVDCTFGATVVSPLTSFERCELRGSGLPVGELRVEGCTVDGERVADRWDGRVSAEEIEDQFLAAYVEAAAAGRAGAVPLEPESPLPTDRGDSGGR
ncbi:uncharacterized low-complexity protein [Sanguibacter keddieii DSM 10542]|uniref:Uncharacterized low-complexity protein n=1 Tax=Sanguibacter keddieii (strain ATCC 51767 / DSM 10542 / NCFB 3025 / ST-74) TaxID=446469 RepID=D1BDF8_SANKS|nr:pentapeptide repeat-containing protein [Sanguibacter keddieii]ACZ21020.1 uncharacterized low-complexity protein [Sanguibacter keddieii DSM 10542]